MKPINNYILEKLKINKSKLSGGLEYTLFPKTREELVKMIKEEIEINGNECSLNHIDVSKITDMRHLFSYSTFNGDISEWDVSNVENMDHMFFYAEEFTGENTNINDWDVSNVENMVCMFWKSGFNQPLNDWDVSNVKSMGNMFRESKFNQDISMWKINKNCDYTMIFLSSDIKEKYKPFKNGKRI